MTQTGSILDELTSSSTVTSIRRTEIRIIENKVALGSNSRTRDE